MEIEKLDHFETLIGSINKMLLDAKNKGVIRNKELSLLNLIFKLTNKCKSSLYESDKNKLLSLYYKLLNKYSFLCKSNISISDNTIIQNNIKNSYTDTNSNTAPIISDPETLYMPDTFEPGDIFTFNELIFITDYYDKENDNPFDVWILSTPEYGNLLFDGELVTTGFTFNIEDAEKLVYIRVSAESYLEQIDFKTSDNNINKLYSNMATITINVDEYINMPPDEIGDNEITTPNRTTVVFSQADFTTNTTPVYDDPEGDAPLKLKVLSLPSQGLLKLNGVNVILNQEILFTQINSGLLTYVPANTNAPYEIDFDFDIADVGSGQYSGL